MAVAMIAAVVVTACWAALTLTDPNKGRYYTPTLRSGVILVWRCVIAAGWLALGYLSLSVAGGPESVWSWVQAQSTAVQVGLWLFLLPWMGALWALQTGWPQWIRVGIVIVIAVATFTLSPQRRPRR